MIKLKKIVAVTLLATLLLVTGCSKNEQVALKIGDQEVSYSLYKEYLAIFENVAILQYGEEAFAQEVNGQKLSDVLRESLVERLTTQEMIAIFMAEQGFKVDDAKVKEEVAKLKSQIASDETMNDVYTKSKVTDTFYEKQVTSSMINEAFNEWLRKEVETNEEYKADIDSAYSSQEFAKARHILFAGEADAMKIKQDIEHGIDTFENMAKIHSGDSGSKENGGDLGYFSKGKMVPEFDAVAFTLEKGKISEPVKSQFGYHLILVEDRNTLKGLIESGADEAAIAPLKEEVLTPFLNQFFEKTMATLKEKNKIENNIATLEAADKTKEEPKEEPKAEEKTEAQEGEEAPKEGK